MAEFDEDSSAPNTRSTFMRQPLLDNSSPQPLHKQLIEVLDIWHAASSSSNYNSQQHLEEIAVLLEKATGDFLKLNPDPLDDRHPSRTHPTAAYGSMLKLIVRRDQFLHILVNDYLLGRDVTVAELAARILLSSLPGLDCATIFSEPDELVPTLYSFATNGDSLLLKAYSMGLLASAMEVQDNAGKYRSQNVNLIPIALERLKQLKEEMESERRRGQGGEEEHELSNSSDGGMANGDGIDVNGERPPSTSSPAPGSPEMDTVSEEVPETGMRLRKRTMEFKEEKPSPPRKKHKTRSKEVVRPFSPPRSTSPSCSNSQWNLIKPVLIGTHKIFPLSIRMHQRLLIQFLASIGEYQDLLAHVYEGNAMSLLFDYISLDFTGDIRLTFDALKYLCSLLVHRKFALEFVAKDGVQALLKVPSTSLAAVGVVTCLYYLSYGEDIMEKVCQLDENTMDQLVEYALWVMEHSHESGMAAGAMFFSYALPFRAILDRFDSRDGLRKVYNYMSTLTLLQEPPPDSDLTEEQMQTSCQTIRNACGALKSYAVSHVYMRMEQFRRSLTASASKSLPSSIISSLRLPPVMQTALPHSKPMILDEENLQQAVSTLATIHRTASMPWKAMEELHRLGLMRLLLTTLPKVSKWNMQNSTRTEMVRNSVQVVWMASTIPRVQSYLCEPVGEHCARTGFDILLSLAEGEGIAEAEVQIAALNACITCICPPLDAEKKRLQLDKTRQRPSPSQELLEKVWLSVRRSNAIMVLNNLMRTRKQITEADQIRALTCRVLTGLARDPEVKQILIKLPLISNNELQDLMKEPVCAEKKSEHARFCQEAKCLIAIVTDKSLKDVKRDLTQEKLWKSHIVSSTKISYSERELLQLIHSHLLNKGLNSTAASLASEADLTSHSPTPPPTLNGTPLKTTKNIGSFPSRNIIRDIRPSSSLSKEPPGQPMAYLRQNMTTPVSNMRKPKMSTTPFPRRLTLRPTPSKSSREERKSIRGGGGTTMELKDIVAEYLRVQHSNCANPVSTCPPFSLFHPHRCPDPTQTRSLPLNVSERWASRPTFSPRLRDRVTRMDERFVFSRYRQYKTYSDLDEMYTTCAFSIDDEHLIVGMFTGEIHWLNVETGADEATMQCHHSYVSAIKPSNDGSMLLTSGTYMPPLSTLWRLGDTHEHLMDFPEEIDVAFSNRVQDRVVGTRTDAATIYDLETGRATQKFVNKYYYQKQYYQFASASFSPCDTLILHDNCLYDTRVADVPIHSFDRLNQLNGGVFHPLGNEIIMNSEVWDIRKFGLVHSVPLLDQCRPIFNSTGNIMVTAQRAASDPYKMVQFSSTLRTFSSIDYTVIATVDTRKPMMDFCLDHNDSQVAVVEVVRSFAQNDFVPRSDETLCRTYEIGKVRAPEDGMDEEEGDNDENGNDDESTDDSDSDSDDDSDSSTLDGRRIDEVMSDFERGEEDEDDEDEDEEEGEEEEDIDAGSDSSGWHTDNGEEEVERIEGGENEEVDGAEGGEEGDEEDDDEEMSDLYLDDGSDGESDGDDPVYNPDVDDRQGTSSIVLNPHLRRRRRGEGGGQGGQ